MILITFSIYISVAGTIFEIRKQIHELRHGLDYDIASFTSPEVMTINGTGASITAGGNVAWTDTQVIYEQTTTVQLAQHGPQSSAQQNFARHRRSYEQKNAAWSYTKCALLYFTGVLITWIPASANRVYSVIHNGEAYALVVYVCAIILPSQGFWNWIIYVVMSWIPCKKLLRDTKARCFAICG